VSGTTQAGDFLLHYWRIISGHKYVILAALAVGITSAAVIAYRMTPIYRATALVLVEDDTPKMVGIQGVYADDSLASTYCKTQGELIKSRAVLRAAAKRLRLDRWKEFEDAKDVVGALAGMVEVTPVPRTTLIRVSAESPDREEVDDIANAVVEAFREESNRWRKSSSQFAAGWIGERIPSLRAEVVAAERRLGEFQKEHKILSPLPSSGGPDRDGSIVLQRLAELSRDVTAVERTRIQLEAELAQVEAAEGDPRAIEILPLVADNPDIQRMDSQILSLETERLDLLTTVRPDHRDVKALDAKLEDLSERRKAEVKEAARALSGRLEAVRVKERVLRSALAEREKEALALNEKLITLGFLKGQVERAKQLYEPLLDRWGKLDLASGLNAVPVQIRDRAEEPLAPIKPRKKLILAAGALVGLVAGVELALLLERSYSKVRSAGELEQIAGLRTVGVIPHMSAKEEAKRYLACQFDPRSAVAEAYRSIRTALLLSKEGNGSAAFLVTSAVDKEGKTTTALNLASALAQTQKRVLLVDGDLRRSSVHRPFGMGTSPGLSTYLTDGAEPERVVRESEVPCLSVVTAGVSPSNPSELLGSERMAEFMGWARDNFDFIVMDSPPVAAVTDSSVLAPHADGVVMVVRADHTPIKVAAHGRGLMETTRARVIGAVLNDVHRQRGRYYGYGYGYYGYGYYNRYYGESSVDAADGARPAMNADVRAQGSTALPAGLPVRRQTGRHG
jgi:capsular exopolysaccharide synthesis family protein